MKKVKERVKSKNNPSKVFVNVFVFGILLGTGFGVSGIREVPSRVNMGNAGPRIVPDFEDYWWQFWNTDIVWGFVFALFFLALGIFVFIKNKKSKIAEQKSDNENPPSA